MPTYVYKCKECETVREVKHEMNAETTVRCDQPTCGGGCRRIIQPTPVHWRKGTFYNKGNDLK